MVLVLAFQKFPSGNYIMWTFITLIYLHFGLMSDYTKLYRKYILSSWLALLYGAYYKPFEIVVLVKTALPVC